MRMSGKESDPSRYPMEKEWTQAYRMYQAEKGGDLAVGTVGLSQTTMRQFCRIIRLTKRSEFSAAYGICMESDRLLI